MSDHAERRLECLRLAVEYNRLPLRDATGAEHRVDAVLEAQRFLSFAEGGTATPFGVASPVPAEQAATIERGDSAIGAESVKEASPLFPAWVGAAFDTVCADAARADQELRDRGLSYADRREAKAQRQVGGHKRLLEALAVYLFDIF